MKLECLREKFREAISLVERITGKNLSLPILNSIILEATKRVLVVRATNLELGIEVSVPCRIFETGLVAVPGTILSNFLFNITGEMVLLEVISGNLIISSSRHKTIIKGYPPTDFPSLPHVIDNRQSFLIPSDYFSMALRRVSHSASLSLVKPEIASVCLYSHGGELAIVATDSFRLAEKIFPPTFKISLTFPYLIIPIKNVSEIIRVLETISGEVLVEYNQHQISLQAERVYLTSRLVDGVYPDYRQIIPTAKLTQVIVKKDHLLETLKVLNIFVDRFGQITITILPTNKKIGFTANNDQGENTSSLEALIEGEAITLGMNIKYLLDCLQSIPADSLQLKFNGPHKPVMIQGVNDPLFTYLIMPINR